VRSSSLLINLAKAIGRIIVSYKDVQNLAGYTSLIFELDTVLKELDQGKYMRQMVNDNVGGEKVKDSSMTLVDTTKLGKTMDSDNVEF